MTRRETGTLIVILALGCMLLAGIPGYTKEPVGSVVALRGDVSAMDESGTTRKISMKDPVYLQDTIRTGKTGRIQLLFSDNTIISLGGSSTLEVSQYLWDQKNRTGAMKTTVHEGVFRIMGGALTRHSPSTFKTDTPAGTIGVRGSMYSGILSDQGLLVAFEGGRGIDVSNGAGSVAITVPGFGTRIASASAAPEPPSRLSQEDIDLINSGLGSSGPETGDEDPEGARGDSSEGQAAAPAASDDDNAPQAGGTIPSPGLDEADLASQESPPDSSVTVLTAGLDQHLDDITDTTAQEATQQDVRDAVQDTGTAMSGSYMSTLIEGVEDPTVNGTRWYGDSGATSQGTTLTGSVSTQDGTPFAFSFTVNAYDDEAVYSNPDPLSTLQDRTVTLMGSAQTFEADVFSASTGAFAIFAVKETAFTDGSTYRFSELGFAGVPSASTPADGVYGYFGPALGFKESTDERSASPAKFFLEVNWHNGRAIGIVHGVPTTGQPDGDNWEMIFFGDVQGTAVTNVVAFGTEAPLGEPHDHEIEGMAGVSASGLFYGNQLEGFGMTGSANLFSIQSDQTGRIGVGHIIAAGLREYEPGVDETAPTGTAQFQGFVLGMAEDMSRPDVDRRLFMNNAPQELSFTVDRDSGTLSGSITAGDILMNDNSINQLPIGGSFGPAYVLDDNFVAILGDSSGSSIATGTSTGGLKPVGNFLVTGDLDRQFSDHVTWGYWEIAYVDPASSADYHLHRPGSLWVAGEPTPADSIADLVSSSFTGRYQGGAQGIRIDAGGFVSQLTGGATDITVNFSTGATNPLSGSIAFDQISLGLSGGFVSASSGVFGAQVTGASSSSVNGAFFGPNADAIGGNFRAQMSDAGYYGIFGGDR
jgi:hypothetical protein